MQLPTEFQPVPMPMAWVKRLFQRFAVMYGEGYANRWGNVPPEQMEQVWAEDLAGLSGDEIAYGLQCCRTKPFPPSLPEFILLCRPSMDPATAHAEAVLGMQERKRGNLGEWSHPAVYWAAVKVGAHDLLNQGYAALRGRWEKELRESFARGRWEPVPAPSMALPAPGQDVTSKAEGQKRVQELAAQAIKPASDPLRWARKIMADPKGRSSIAVEMARRALGESA